MGANDADALALLPLSAAVIADERRPSEDALEAAAEAFEACMETFGDGRRCPGRNRRRCDRVRSPGRGRVVGYVEHRAGHRRQRGLGVQRPGTPGHLSPDGRLCGRRGHGLTGRGRTNRRRAATCVETVLARYTPGFEIFAVMLESHFAARAAAAANDDARATIAQTEATTVARVRGVAGQVRTGLTQQAPGGRAPEQPRNTRSSTGC